MGDVDLREFSNGNAPGDVDLREFSNGKASGDVDLREFSNGKVSGDVDLREFSNGKALGDVKNANSSKEEGAAVFDGDVGVYRRDTFFEVGLGRATKSGCYGRDASRS